MSWTTEQNLISARFDAQCPVAAARRDYTAIGGPAFNPPKVDLVTPTNSVWIRLEVFGVPQSSRPFAIGGAAPNYREGFIVQQIYFPSGTGEAYVSTIVDSCRTIFHRYNFNPSSPQVESRDAGQPDRVQGEFGEFSRIDVLTPYYVIE